MSEDKLYYVQYTGSEVVVLGKAGKFMPGTSAYLREADARAAAARGDFVVQGLDASSSSTKPAANSSSSPAPASATAPVANEKKEAKAEDKKPDEKKADDKKPEEKKADDKKADDKKAEEKK